MREFITCCCLGLLVILGVAVFGEEPPTPNQQKCLMPYIHRDIVADPTIRTCYDVKQGVRTILDCKTLVTMEPFKAVKGCFQ
jgi:hypothetical protein